MIKNINLIQGIQKDGFVEIKNFIGDEKMSLLKNFVNSKLEENNYEYFFLTSTKDQEKTLLNDDIFFKKIEDLLKKITSDLNFSIRKDEKLYKVLRVVTGEKSRKVSLKYHFDAHLLTLLIPVYIPERENSDNGNLIIIKNLRKLTKNLFINIIQKLFFQSNFFKKIFIDKNLIKKKTLNLKPGNVYIFNGFTTLHTNMNIDPRDVRATILVHYYDIFRNSFLVNMNRKRRIKKEQKNMILNKKKN